MTVIAVICSAIAVTIVLNGCGAGSLLGDLEWDHARSPRRVQTVIDPLTELKFESAILLHNNLGGQGPSKNWSPDGVCKECILYGMVGTANGHHFDMKVELVNDAAKENYKIPRKNHNGLDGYFGTVSVRTGTEAKLKFTFLQDGEEIIVPDFFFSFFDIDESLTSSEFIKVHPGYADTFEPENKEFDVATKKNKKGKEFKEITSSEHGTVCDNPDHPMVSDELVCAENPYTPNGVNRQKRMFTVRYKEKSKFFVDFSSHLKLSADSRRTTKGGRVMLFAGASPLVQEIIDAESASASDVPDVATPPVVNPPPVFGTPPVLPPSNFLPPTGAVPPPLLGGLPSGAAIPPVSSLPAPVPIGQCNELDLSRPLTMNNLGNQGPLSGSPYMRYHKVTTTADGQDVDLFVKVTNPGASSPDEYRAPDNNHNGNGNTGPDNFFGSISVATGHTAKLKFIFVKTGTLQRVKLPNFGITIYDVDKSLTSKEEVYVRGYEEISIPDGAQYEEKIHPTEHKGKVITAMEMGTVCDNPAHASDRGTITCNGNTVDRSKRLLSMHFKNKNLFSLDFTSIESADNQRPEGKGGRVFLFSGTCTL
jgi:hypothetical protein